MAVELEGQARMSAVTVRLVDPGHGGELLWEHALTAEEIAQGRFERLDYDLFTKEYVQSHVDLLRQGYEPDPILEVTYTVTGSDGAEETFTERAEPADELWISGRYDLKDPSEDFLSYFMEETTYPDAFVIRIDPSPYGALTVAYGQGLTLGPGDVAVTILADGQMISGEGAHLERTEVAYPQGTRYAYALVVPRPASLPEAGTVEITITRRLIHYPDTLRTDVKTVEY